MQPLWGNHSAGAAAVDERLGKDNRCNHLGDTAHSATSRQLAKGNIEITGGVISNFSRPAFSQVQPVIISFEASKIPGFCPV